MEDLSSSNNMRPGMSKSKSWNKSWISRISFNIRIKKRSRSLPKRASTKFKTKILRMLTQHFLRTWPPRLFKPDRRNSKGSVTITEAEATSGTITIVETTAVANKTMVAEEGTSSNRLCRSQWWWALVNNKCMANLNSSTCNHPQIKWTWCRLHKCINKTLSRSHREVIQLVNNHHSRECTRQICRCNKTLCIPYRCKTSMK